MLVCQPVYGEWRHKSMGIQICASTLPARDEPHEQTRNKTDAPAHKTVLLLADVATRGVRQSVIMM